MINESIKPKNIFSVNPNVDLMAENIIQTKNGIMISLIIKHCVYEEDYAWNPSRCFATVKEL